MSNLSDLIPAGGGQNNTDFVADGAIASGKPVILTAAGKAAEIVETPSSGGSEVVYESASAMSQTVSFDPSNVNTFIVAYRDYGNSSYGTVAVGTVSGSTVSFGTPVVFGSFDTRFISSSFDPNTANQFVLAYKDQDDTQRIYSIIGTVSGTSASFGTGVLVDSGNYSGYPAVAFDPNTTNQFLVAYSDGDNSSHGTAVVGTVSGTAISFASPVVFNAASTSTKSVSFDPNVAYKFVVAYTDSGNSNYGTGIVGTLSGTTPSFGSEYVFSSTTVDDPAVSFDPSTANSFVVCWRDTTTSSDGIGIVGTVASTTISYGSQSTFSTGTVQYTSVAFNPTVAGEFVVAYYDSVAVNGQFNSGQISGTDITYGDVTTFNTGASEELSMAMVPDSSGKFVPCYADAANSNYGTAAVWTLGSTNLTSSNLLGIAAGAILDTATGTINTWGSRNEVQTSLTIASDYYAQNDGRLAAGVEYEPYGLSGAAYDSKSFGVGSQESAGEGLAFNTDGTKMYVVGGGSDTVYEYDLSTAFDISTAAYNSISFSVASQETTPGGLDFSSDGTKMYIAGYTNDTVFQYTLSTPWDLSTVSYASLSFDVSGEEDGLQFVVFNPAGSKMYIRGFTNNTFYQYSLSTPYNVSTASYDSVSFSPTAQGSQPISLAFNADGTKCFVANGNTDAIFQYSLSSAYDVGTASYDSISLDVSSQDNQPKDIAFSTDGTRLFLMGQQYNTVFQYSMTALAYSTTFLVGKALSATQINIKDYTG